MPGLDRFKPYIGSTMRIKTSGGEGYVMKSEEQGRFS